MQDLLKQWDTICPLLKEKKWMLFLDFDGTLAPIVDMPGHAVLDSAVRTILKKLSLMLPAMIVIISGRALDDVRNRVGIDTIVYAGNHGLEMSGPEVSFVGPVTFQMKQAIDEVRCLLEREVVAIPGAILENKHLTLSIHYRLVAESLVPNLARMVQQLIDPWVKRNVLMVRTGKCVYEVRPCVAWDKGAAVVWLLEQRRAHHTVEIVPIYFGDDETDEDVFRAIQTRGITVHVGSASSSCARYSVESPREVFLFLNNFYTWSSERHYAS